MNLSVSQQQWKWTKSQLKATPDPTRVDLLDIGCGHGGFLMAAGQDGVRAVGLEIDPQAAQFCRDRGLEVSAGSIFDTGVPDGPWDVITFWDVLDHLEQPRQALEMAVRKLKPEGILIVRGRNAAVHARAKISYARYRSIAARLGLRDLAVVHRWGLTAKGYCSLLKAAGLGTVTLHPGVPTPGDRYGSLGHQMMGAIIKSSIRFGGLAAFLGSAKHLYPFPSILAVGIKR